MKKYIVLDTETTGLSVEEGHKIIEIGAVLLEDRNKSTNYFHTYINPQRLIEEEAIKVHGITNEALEDKPLFDEIVDEFLEFVQDSSLVIHNAAFDLGFLNNEIKLASSKNPLLEDICDVIDTLAVARNKFPGQRNSLDALANRFDINNYDRTFHGALLDANILADVFLNLTGGQSKFSFSKNAANIESNENRKEKINFTEYSLVEFKANDEDISRHNERVKEISEIADSKAIWDMYK
jgi:DNA polymerase-3 subunit epsilon